MDPRLNDLIALIESEHPHVQASRDAASELDRFVNSSGFPIPPDMRAFYLRFHSATLFEQYQFLPVQEWLRTGAALLGSEWVESECPSWYAFCDVFDGDFVGIDFATEPDGPNWILDCDHEDVPERHVIANSFTEFLVQVLSVPEAKYYLADGFVRLATLSVPYNPPLDMLRRDFHRWSLDPEIGPEMCKREGCNRLRVKLSVFCRRHHFESINGLAYPFDE